MRWLCVLWLSLCSLSAVAQTADEKAETFYLDGLCAQFKGNYAEAYELFSHTLELQPDHVGALYVMANFARAMKNDSVAVNLMERASRIDADNYWIKQALVQLYVHQHREADAIATLEAMAKAYPQKSDVLLMLVDMYGQQQDYEHVVKTLDRIELLEGKSEQLSMEKVRIYAAMKDEKRAFAEMKALAEEYPNDIRYRVLIGDYHLDNGHPEKAYAVYSQLEQEEPNNVLVQLSLAKYYRQEGPDSLYQQAYLRLLTNEQLDADTRFEGVQEIVREELRQQADTTRVMQLFRQLLDYPQEDERIAELCAVYMISSDMPNDAVKPILYQVLDINPENEQARLQLLSYAVSENDAESVIRLCKTAVDYGSTSLVYYYYLSVAYLQQERYEETLSTIRLGLQKVEDRSEVAMLANMYAISGDIYHRLGNDRMAFEAYDSCLLYRPDDAMALNNYAYYLSLHKKDLARAEKMSLRSNELETENPTYLDTYAWILFQQRRYAESRVVMDSVIVLLGDSISADDAGLVEHAGDIYAQCGDVDKAMEFWRQAQQLGSDSATLEEKLRKRKYIEEKQK